LKTLEDFPITGHRAGGDPLWPWSILLTRVRHPSWLLYCIAMDLSGWRPLVDPGLEGALQWPSP